LLALSVSPAGRAQAVGAQPEATPRVRLLLTAADKDGGPFADLKPEDIRVTADGVVRQVVELKQRSGLPLFLAIALDTSASQEAILPGTRALADTFVREFMRAGVDRAAFITFMGKTTVAQEMTADMSKVREAIARAAFIPPPGYVRGGIIVGNPPPALKNAGSSSIWDTVRLIAGEVMPPASIEGRRAVLLITDGVDTSSSTKLDKAVAAALQSNLAVYAIGVGDAKSFDGVDTGALRKIAERTGGRAFFPKQPKDRSVLSAQIREDLLSQYVVAFDAPDTVRASEMTKIKIEVVNPELRQRGIRLAYPQGFYAGNAPTAIKR
jgi:Ca-activated chloride channel family protein